MDRFATVDLEGDLAAVLQVVPVRAGVAQLLGPEARNLLIGRPANLRRWAATHLGQGRPPRPGKRPPTNLAPVAKALRYVVTTSPFQQRLVYERLMAPVVPLEKRRDLKRPAWIHLDPSERFPRLSVRMERGDAGGLFGPFRDKKAAERALAALHKAVPLRPCDFVFEPDPALPLGLGCLFAQVRSCSAPCLVRITEDDYRGLAREVEARLADPSVRDPGSPLPAGVARSDTRALVVETAAEGLELYPVVAGAVREDAAVVVAEPDLDAGLARLQWPETAAADDTPWLSAWLYAPRKSGAYLVVSDPGALAARVRAALAPPCVG